MLIKKSVNTEKRLATFIVLEPQLEDGTTNDLHGDWYSEEEVEKACHNFNEFCGKANLFHSIETELMTFVESYTAPVDFELNEQPIKKGTWLAVCKFNDDTLWEGVKSGKYNGLSIQCNAEVETLEE